MKAWVINKIGPISLGAEPLELIDRERPVPGPGEIVIKVSVCGVCHTELDEIEGRTPPNELPRIPGHQIVGVVRAHGAGAGALPLGTRVGVAWLNSACGNCPQCKDGMENLCSEFVATGRDADGGYAEYVKVRESFAIPIPDPISDTFAAPLLCAGAVGYRSMILAQLDSHSTLGFAGFGASAHLVLQMVRCRYPGIKTAVFARSDGQCEFALSLGADWAGAHDERPPFALNAIIDTTPVWKPVVAALDALAPGGRLIINAIRKEDVDKGELMTLDYARHLWMEKEVKSVANVTRRDVTECLKLAAAAGIRPETDVYPFEQANQALVDLKSGHNRGAKVLVVSQVQK